MRLSALRNVLLRIMLFVVVLPLTLVAGYYTTTRLIPDTKPGLFLEDEDLAAAARRALILARLGCVEGLGSVFGLKLQVIEIELEPGYCPPRLENTRSFRARVRSYTLFGIPMSTISVDSCGSTRCGFG